MRIITDPDEFFRAIDGDINHWGPMIIVLIASVSAATPVLVHIYYQSRVAPSELGAFFVVGGAVGFIFGVLAAFGLWLLYAVVMHYVARYLGGKGSLRSTVTTSGYGYLPMIISGLFSAVALHTTIRAQLAAGGVEGIQGLQVTPQTHSLLLVGVMITVLCMGWRLILWTFAVKNVHKISLMRSLIVALIPTVFTVGYTLAQAA